MLGYYGREIYRQAPPIPERVMTTEGLVLFPGEGILDGQNVWQSLGGQQLGSIWGHGAYGAPDWSADWLHRECMYLLEHWSREEHGLWYARSADFLQSGLMNVLRWLRVVGDTIFAVGVMALAWFVVGLKTGWSLQDRPDPAMQAAEAEGDLADATA